MKRINHFCAVALLLLCQPTYATLLDSGFGSTFDTASGLEWLDVNQTSGQSFNTAIANFGGAGWVHATDTQLCGLFSSLGDVLSGCGGLGVGFGTIGVSSVSTLVSLLGATNSGSLAGIYAPHSDAPEEVGLACLAGASAFCTSAPGWYTQSGWAGKNGTNTAVGNFLVRAGTPPNVPEPASLALLGLGLIGLGFGKRRKI